MELRQASQHLLSRNLPNIDLYAFRFATPRHLPGGRDALIRVDIKTDDVLLMHLKEPLRLVGNTHLNSDGEATKITITEI